MRTAVGACAREGGVDSAGLSPWEELLERRRTEDRTWLIAPSDPRQSGDHISISHAALYRRCREITHALLDLAPPGARAVVVMDNSVQAAITLISVLASDLVAVPVSPRSLGRSDDAWKSTLSRVCRDSRASLVLADADHVAALKPGFIQASLSFDTLADLRHSGAPRRARRWATDLALLQYTSGTTAAARGVCLTHGQLIDNVDAIARQVSVGAADVGLCWLPLFHDMGLIASLLGPLRWGIPLVLMRPRQFVLRPEAWLHAVSRFGVTICAAPSSAYAICAAKVSEAKLAGVDLRSWRAAFVGAELIHPRTLDAFTRRFAPHGFRPDAFYPAYGLAECVTAATIAEPRAAAPKVDWVSMESLARGLATPVERSAASSPDNPTARGVVCVGTAIDRHELRIVGDGGTQCRDRELGEIQLRGPCVTGGYFDHEERTTSGESGWLRTGDLGYIVAGELYVVGRSKGMLKRGGCRVDCAYVEIAVEHAICARAGTLVAFGVPGDPTRGEDLVVLAETRLSDEVERQRLIEAVVRAVRQVLPFGPDRVVLARPGTVQRTTSGKVQRDATRDAYLAMDPAR